MLQADKQAETSDYNRQELEDLNADLQAKQLASMQCIRILDIEIEQAEGPTQSPQMLTRSHSAADVIPRQVRGKRNSILFLVSAICFGPLL